jgi:hypothetical protein
VAVAPAPAPVPVPVRILVVGDSIVGDLAGGLERWAPAHGAVVTSHIRVGCPIARGGALIRPDGTLFVVPAGCNWTNDWPADVARFKPDVVVVGAGLIDVIDRTNPAFTGVGHAGQPAVDRWLTTEFAAAVAALSPTGHPHVVWVAPPCVRPPVTVPDYNARLRALRNGPIAALARHDGVGVADLGAQECAGDSSLPAVAGVADARPDGIHLTAAAADALTTSWFGPYVLAAAAAAAAVR